MTKIDDLRVTIFADGADLESIKSLAENPLIKGFTTNPTLMRQAGIPDYLDFANDVLEIIQGAPISLEVFSDDFIEMRRQAKKLAALGTNVFVKIPITNTLGESSAPLVKELAGDGVQLNVTAIFTQEQVEETARSLEGGPDAFVSVFAGRIADAGVDPIPVVADSLKILETNSQAKLIWASPREVLNIVQASDVGCHVITVTHDLLKKLPSLGKDLGEFSLDTVKMFADDAALAGYQL